MGKNLVNLGEIWSIWAKFGQFGRNLPKSGQSLEKVSQPRVLRFHSNKYDFLKQE